MFGITCTLGLCKEVTSWRNLSGEKNYFVFGSKPHVMTTTALDFLIKIINNLYRDFRDSLLAISHSQFLKVEKL
jgi:hypothetical protein